MALFSIEKMPRDLPLWELLITDLGRPGAARIARALGVGVSSVYRWNAAGAAPRMACLALFWLTRWGRSQVNADAVNDALMCAQLARAWREECNRLAAKLPCELAWPAIEPAALPVPAESGLALDLPGATAPVSALLEVRQAHPDLSCAPARVAPSVPTPETDPPIPGGSANAPASPGAPSVRARAWGAGAPPTACRAMPPRLDHADRAHPARRAAR